MICDNVALQPTKKRRHESSEASDHSVASPSATSEPTATQQSEPALNQQSKSNPNHHSEPSLASPSAIEQYASYLKSVYIKQKPPMYDKLPQIEVRKYIKLALIGKDDITPEEADEFTLSTMHGSIHDITRKKQPITFDQIAQLEDGSEPKGILIDGAPGIGKSTFSWKLCRKWGKGKILQQYQLLVMLRLRDNRVRRATDVLHLFRHPDMGTQEAAAKEIVRRRGKGLLLLLEGFDELPADLRSEDSLFMRIITGVELPEATVMITSRPSASGLLLATCRDDISQHIEIIGFTPDDVQCYIRTAFEDNPSLQSGLQEYLSCYPHMKSMMYVPLNCAIVTQVYKNSIKDRFIPKTMSGLYIPKTMSDLYTSLVRSLLLCYLHEHPVHGRKVWRLRSFSELPHDVFHQLRELGRIAHEGIVQGQQVIFSDLPSDFDGLGLMQSMNELYVDEGSTVSFSFFHLTLQEFLAALHLSEQPIESQIKSFQEYGSKVHNRFLYGHFQITLQFLAGLGKFAGYPTDRIRSIFSNSESTSELQITLDGLHWIFEAQGSSSICEAIGVSKVSPLLHYRRLSPFDCFVLGYCVCHTDCPWKIDLEDCGIGDKGVEMLVRGTQEIEPCRSGYISVLGLKHNQITSSGLNQLMNSPTLLKLDELQLGLNLLGNGGAAPLLSSRLGHSIKHLNLHTTGIGVEDCRALGELLSSYSTLEHLDISTNDLTSETVQLLFSGIQHTSALKWLSLDFNPLGNGGAVPLLKSRVAHNLSCLRLRDTGIGEEDCRALCSLLLASTSLQWIDISNNDLPSVAMQLIVSGLQDNTTVNNLYVMKNSLDSEAAVSLLKSPLAHRLHHFSLTVTGVEDCRALGELLTTPQKLQFLDISAGSGLPPEAMELIITGLQNNTKLKRLRVWDFHFSLQNCISLASVLRNHRLLFALWLQHCSIDDADGASELASSLFRNDTLQIFRLSHTPIGIKGACAFAEMLHHNNYLEDLNLSQVSIDVEGTQKLIESLSHNATLLRLALPSKYKSSVNTSEAYKKERDRIRWK